MTRSTIPLLAAGVLVFCTGTRADIVVNRFDSASEISQWRFDYGGVTHTESFDPTMDAGGSTSSGSMKIVLQFDPALGGNNKGAYTHDFFPAMDGTAFSGMSMDVKVDPNSAPDAFNNNGYFKLVIRNNDSYDFNQQFGDNTKAADGWRHISVSPLVGGPTAYNHIRGITWELYGGPSQNINGPVTLWIDNVVFNQVPEPGSCTLVGAALLAVLRRRR